MTGTFPAYGMSPSLSTITSTSSSITSSIPDTEREYSSLSLGLTQQMGQVGGLVRDPLVHRGEPSRGLYSFRTSHRSSSPEGTQSLPEHCLLLNVP